ncbi:hypothetical protein [Sphingobacterium lumbrici]|uniref:hypothetical protein n=1 Tax=Sphingobacterium lumbrici TaxID=2559600 RepID=UPI00112AAB81|nr:hypothetical protein [Sphingobacterium lumbrici]
MYRPKPKRQSDGLLVCTKILDFFHIRHTQLYLANAIEAHVDSPSLLSIKDVLSEYGIESVAIRKGTTRRAQQYGLVKEWCILKQENVQWKFLALPFLVIVMW